MRWQQVFVKYELNTGIHLLWHEAKHTHTLTIQKCSRERRYRKKKVSKKRKIDRWRGDGKMHRHVCVHHFFHHENAAFSWMFESIRLWIDNNKMHMCAAKTKRAKCLCRFASVELMTVQHEKFILCRNECSVSVSWVFAVLNRPIIVMKTTSMVCW